MFPGGYLHVFTYVHHVNPGCQNSICFMFPDSRSELPCGSQVVDDVWMLGER